MIKFYQLYKGYSHNEIQLRELQRGRDIPQKGRSKMPRSLKRALLLLTAAAMLLTVLGGCGDGTTQSNGGSGSAVSGELPADGNSVTVGIAQDLDSLDPHKAVNAGTSEVLFNLFEGLMKASPDGGVRPAVASDYQMSDDGLSYTFTLREGVTFHNGNKVTLEDVLYSLERCAGSENDGAPLIAAFSNVADISADAEGRVVVTLTQPSLEFLNAMTAAIIPAGPPPMTAMVFFIYFLFLTSYFSSTVASSSMVLSNTASASATTWGLVRSMPAIFSSSSG